MSGGHQEYAAAVDLGSTTIVVYLLSLAADKDYCIEGMESSANPQAEYGKDVVSRISYIGEDRKRLDKMQNIAVKSCEGLIQKLCVKCRVSSRAVREIVFAGNPTMCHILLGYLPKTLALAPFAHQYRGGQTAQGRNLHFEEFADAKIYVIPAIAGHVGADTVAAMLATVKKQHTEQLMIDIGTNGEIVLEHDGGYYACSAAAGPALEGGELTHGMIAADGAVTKVHLEEKRTGKYHIAWIGKERKFRPKGICGSGIVDAIAMLCDMGVIMENGTLLNAGEAKNKGIAYGICKRLAAVEGENIFVLYIDREQVLLQAKEFPKQFLRYIKDEKNDVLYITQSDIRAVQLAKGALYAAMRILLHVAGLQPEDLEKVYVAGAFGNYISIDSAIRIGLFPPEWKNRIIMVGNAAGEGTCAVAASSEAREWAEKIPENVRHIPLAESKVFQEYYLEAMNFPLLKG